MLQSFEATTRPEQGPPRLARLREALAAGGFDAVLVPRADAHQGEYVAPCDERLAWLTGFTGSAGFCIATRDRAALFVDGRYRIQARAQVDGAAFAVVPWPETQPGSWLKDALPAGGRVAFDPWLHSREELDRLREALEGSGITLCESDNLVDRIWTGRPPPPDAPAEIFPTEVAGLAAGDKRRAAAEALARAGQRAAVLTLPDGIAWLLNIRGGDLPRVPVTRAFAVLHDDGRVDLFADPAKFDAALRAHLGPAVALHPPAAFASALAGLAGPVRVDRASAPAAVAAILEGAGIPVAWERDPTVLPKARKTAAEIAATAGAHLVDAAAMVRFLAWLDAEAPSGRLTEIDAVRALETFRREGGPLRDLAFDTICGSGPNGAIVHYRVTEDSNRRILPGELLLIDSGGQYPGGTTDVTRTVAVGRAPEAARGPFTRVLKGMIAISRLRWPKGLAGQHLDALARYPLWLAGQDYDHGTGHGVGVFLSVHEGPQRLSRLSDVPLEPGMILSNEPGYYREGAFGIRTENLVVVVPAPPLEGADAREMLAFRTLTHVPVDRRVILPELLDADERAWLDAYHAEVCASVGPLLEGRARAWLEAATRPL